MTPHRLRPWAWAAIILVGVALRAPALGVGRLGDDWYHLAMVEGTYPVARSATDLYDFIDDDPKEHGLLRDRGAFPWWTSPSLALSPWRPLTSATLALDHALFGRGAAGPHAVSLAAWAALLLAAAWWLRAVLPAPAGLLALALLALDESATVPIAWIANRASLLAGAFGLAAAGVLARTRGRSDPRALALVALPASLAVAAGEYGLAVVGAAVAHELVADPRARREGRGRLAAALAPCVLYVVAWKLLGHGARGTTAYVDPLSQPAAWAVTVRERALAFVGELTCAVPIDVTNTRPAVTLGALAVAVALAAVVLARAEAAQRRAALALLAASGVAVVPVLSAPLNGRVLLPAAPWWSAALAALAWCAWRGAPGPATWLLRALVGLWVTAHLTVAPTRAWAELRELAAWKPAAIPWRALPGVDACRAAGQAHVLLAAGDFGRLHTAGLYWQARGCERPRAWRVLSAPAGAAIVLRDGPRSLELRAPDGAPVIGWHGMLWRVDAPFRAGERFRVAGMEAEVLAAEGGRPTRVRYTFDVPLDDPRVVLWMATDAGFEQVPPPPVGRGRLVLPTTTRFW
ncbi:MAG: hypothetical protein U0324_21650 [Polyangiales bacterium]